jgi:hypothetical protein
MAQILDQQKKSKFSKSNLMLGGARMQEIFNYDYVQTTPPLPDVRYSQEKLASFQRDFGAEINLPPRF